MKKLLLSFSILFIVSCGGGGGGGVPFALTLVAGIFTTNEDTSLSGSIGATANEVVTLSYSITTPPSNGTLTLASGGSFTYEPSANFNGSDSFAYSVTASEKTITKAGSASITITAVNDAPSISITQITPDDYTAYPLLISSTGLIEVALTLDDIDNENTELTLEASSTEGAVTLTYDSSASMTSATIDISQIALAGKVDITFSISDGVESVSDTMKFWYAKQETIKDTGNDMVYTFFGDQEDTKRKMNKVIAIDALATEALVLNARNALKEFKRFIGENGLNEIINDYMNILVVETPVGEASGLGVKIHGSGECSGESRDDDMYCFENDFISALRTYLGNYFDDIDDISIITGVDGRGTAKFSERISIQNLTDDDDFYTNALLRTLKHEFGHTLAQLGDEYNSDFTRGDIECVDETDTYDYPCQIMDLNPNTTSQQTPEVVRWKHLIDDVTNTNGFHNNLETGIGMYEGTYTGPKTYRPSFENIMAGSYDTKNPTDARSYYNFQTPELVGNAWDQVGQEAFVIEMLKRQGLHDISAAFDDDSNIIVTTTLSVDSSVYDINWYIDGALDASLKNSLSIVLERKTTGYSSAAVRVSEITQKHLKSIDDANTFRDVYEGVFSDRSIVYCSIFGIDDYSSEPGYEDSYCKPSARAYLDGGSNTVVVDPDVPSLMSNSNIRYFYERSGLGAQFGIDWSKF